MMMMSVLKFGSLCRKGDSFDGGSSCKVAKSYSYEEVVRVQRIWTRKFRRVRTYILVDNYFATGPTIEHVKSIRWDCYLFFLQFHLIAFVCV
jgi:hypothetical protein